MEQQQPLKTRFYPLYTALIAAGMMLLIYIVLGIWPFGNATVLTGDLNNQYLPYFSHFKRAFAGDAGFTYGFDKSLGGNLTGLFAYYVSSPFNLLYLLVPLSGFPILASVLFAVKVSLACGFCNLYLTRKFSSLGAAGIALSLGYGFSAYCFAFAQNIMWHDVVLLLPLICLAIDRIIAGKNNLPYIALLALAVFSNFYIAFSTCLFAALYYLYSMLLEKREKTLWKKTLLSFGGGSLLAGGLCAALLLPALANVSDSKGGLLGYTLTFETNFPLRRLAERFVVGNFVWSDVIDGLPEIYCGLLALALAVCYFVSRKISLREKLLSGGVTLLFVLSFWLKDLDVLWHGLTEPVWFPHRYSYLFSFWLILLAATAVARQLLEKKTLLFAGGGLAAALLLMIIFPIGVSRSKMLLTLAGLLLLLAGFYWLAVAQGKRLRRGLSIGLVAIVALELSLGGYYVARQFESYSLDEYQTFINDTGGALSAIQNADDGSYRVEKTHWRTLNDPMLLGYNGIAHFGSTQDTAAYNTLMNLGYRNQAGIGSYNYGSTAFADSVLGIRYVFTNGQYPLAAHLTPSYIAAPQSVYQNPYAMPMLFTVPAGGQATAYPTAEIESDVFAWQNTLYSALGGEGELFSPAPARLVSPDGEELPFVGTLLYNSQYEITAQTTGYHYAIIEGPMTDMIMYINNQPVGRYFSAVNWGVINLGWLEQGQRSTLNFRTGNDVPVDVEITAAYFYSIDDEKLQQLAGRLNEQAGSFTLRDGQVTGTFTATGERMLFTSIPYDENWSATVNGQPAQPVRFMGGFLALPLAEGENQVSLRFRPQNATPGWVVTGLCLVLFAGLLVLQWRKWHIGKTAAKASAKQAAAPSGKTRKKRRKKQK